MAGNAFKTRHGVVKLSATEKVSNKKKNFSSQNAWCNNTYSPNLRPCSITEVYLHVELEQLMHLANKNLFRPSVPSWDTNNKS